MKNKKREFTNPIGNFFGKTIFQTIKDNNVEYLFDRVARGDQDGYPLDQLDKNEILFAPGLIYKKVVNG